MKRYRVQPSWAISAPGMMEYLKAILWSCGFIAFALAVESGTVSSLVIRLATEIAVPVLTWMGDSLAPEMAALFSCGHGFVNRRGRGNI